MLFQKANVNSYKAILISNERVKKLKQKALYKQIKDYEKKIKYSLDERDKFLKKLKYLKMRADVKRLPVSLNSCIKYYELDKEEEKIIHNQNYGIERFRLKDIEATIHPGYGDKGDNSKTFISNFLSLARGDKVIEFFEQNPQYINRELKMPEMVMKDEHAICLIEKNGKYIVEDGNNRLTVLMINYLIRKTKLHDQESIDLLDKEFTFYGKVKSLTLNKDINSIETIRKVR